MKMWTIIWIVIASVLVLAGGIIFTKVMSSLNWDFTKLSTVNYQTNEHKINEPYKNISINTDTADIVFVPSQDASSTVVIREYDNLKHTVSVKDDTLIVDLKDARKWYEYIGITFGTPKIILYIPEGEYGTLTIRTSTGSSNIPEDYAFESIKILQSTGDTTVHCDVKNGVKIKLSTGSINIENIKAGSLDLAVTTGKITATNIDSRGDFILNVSTGRTYLTDVKCKSFISEGDTGHINMKNVVASDKIDIERSTGDVKLDMCDASEICIETDTGDVTGKLLTDKVFFAESDTGKIRVPKSTSGGICEIETDTGDIIFE